jgi:hypothetical protein
VYLILSDQPQETVLEVIVSYFVNRQPNRTEQPQVPKEPLAEAIPKPLKSTAATLGNDASKDITHLLFGKPNRTFPEEWKQGFYFNPPNSQNILQYGLVQRKVVI